MKTEPLGIGVVGCGHIAHQLVAAARAEQGEILACCSRRESSARSFAERHGGNGHPPIAVEPTLEALLQRPEVELVLIATPPDLHASQTLQALAAGKHVLCEKPSTLDPADDMTIADAARKTGLHVAGFSSRLRYGGFTSLAKEAIEEGRLGRIYRVEARFARTRGRPGIDLLADNHWFTDKKRAGGGILADMGVYLLDQILHLLDWPEPRTVEATAFRGHPHALPSERIHDVEEQLTLFSRLSNGVTLTLDLSGRSHEPPLHRLVLLGSRAGLRIEHGEDRAVYSLMQVRPGDEPKKSHNLEEVAKWKPALFDSRALFRQFHHAIRCGGEPPGATPAQSESINRLIQLAYRSVETGREIVP